MSNTTKTIINRQWCIIDLLTKTDHYLSTEDIKQYLQSKNITAELRTIQRDLNDLKEFFHWNVVQTISRMVGVGQEYRIVKKQELTLVQVLVSSDRNTTARPSVQ